MLPCPYLLTFPNKLWQMVQTPLPPYSTLVYQIQTILLVCIVVMYELHFQEVVDCSTNAPELYSYHSFFFGLKIIGIQNTFPAPMKASIMLATTDRCPGIILTYTILSNTAISM